MKSLAPSIALLGALLVSQAPAQRPLRFLSATPFKLSTPTGADVPALVVPVDTGGVYLVGWVECATAPGPRVFVRKIGPAGRQVWVRTLAWGSSIPSCASEVSVTGACVDGQGGLVLVGYSSDIGLGGPSLGGSDGYAVRFDGRGQMLWSNRLGSAGEERANSVAPDGLGGFLVSGDALGGDYGSQGSSSVDAFVTRLDAAGAESWVTRYVRPGRRVTFDGIALDGAGGAHVCGFTVTPDPDPFVADVVRPFRARFDSSGQLLWAVEDALGFAFVGTQSLAPDGAGGVYIATYEYGQFTTINQLRRWDPLGGLVWSTDVQPLQGNATCEAVCVLSDGSPLVVGVADSNETGNTLPVGYAAVYSPAGVLETLHSFPPAAAFAWSFYFRVALDSSDGLMVLGSESPTGNQTPTTASRDLLVRYATRNIAQLHCAGEPNSTGRPGRLFAEGRLELSTNRFTLWTQDLPVHSFGFVVASTSPGFIPSPGGGQGNLCLGGAIGRFLRPGELGFTLFGDGFYLDISLDDVPGPSGIVSVVPGVPWYFQAWYRDTHPSATTNFTDAVEVVFQ